jgi:hypothetical protein
MVLISDSRQTRGPAVANQEASSNMPNRRNNAQSNDLMASQSVMLHRMVFPMHTLQFTAPVYHIPHTGHIDPRFAGLPWFV